MTLSTVELNNLKYAYSGGRVAGPAPALEPPLLY